VIVPVGDLVLAGCRGSLGWMLGLMSLISLEGIWIGFRGRIGLIKRLLCWSMSVWAGNRDEDASPKRLFI